MGTPCGRRVTLPRCRVMGPLSREAIYAGLVGKLGIVAVAGTGVEANLNLRSTLQPFEDSQQVANFAPVV